MTFSICIQIHEANLAQLVKHNAIKSYSVKPADKYENVVIEFMYETSFLGSALVNMLENQDIPCTLISIESR